MHEEKNIDRFWVYNGAVFISSSDSKDDKGTKIDHLNDLEREPFLGTISHQSFN